MVKNKWISCFFSLLLLFACQKENWKEYQGGFLLSLAEITTTVKSKADPNDLKDQIDTKEFTLKITNTKSNKSLYDGTFQEYVAAPEGTYSIEVTSGENPTLAIDHPYYTGEEDAATITALQSTAVTIECCVANALTSFIIPEEEQKQLNALFSSYTIQATNDNEKLSLENFKQSFYYPANSTPRFTFVGTFIDGTSFSQVLTAEKLSDPTTFAAGMHCKITLKVTEPAQGLDLISIQKVEVNEATITETIPVSWLPAPTISTETATATTWVETETTNLPSGNTYTISAASPIDDIIFDVSGFESPDYVALGEDYQVYKWSSASNLIESVGISVTFSDDKKTATIELDDCLQNLLSDPDGTNNVLTITAQANERKCSITTPTYRVEPPVFSVSYLPGNVWTKEFTVNELAENEVTSGTYATLKDNMTYQYSVDGTNWTSFNGSSNLHTGSKQLTPNTTYQVRGLYANRIPGTAIQIKTYPITELSNGNFETYSIVSGEDEKFWKDYGARYEWTSWATLNGLTCDYCDVTAYRYNTRSGTRPITGTDAYNNTSVWIATIGWGYGSTIGGTKYQTPGELFLGTLTDIDHKNDTATKTYGISYDSHPTGVHFYYKYIPYDSDKTDIYVQVLHDNTILGSQKLEQSSTVGSGNNYIEHTMSIDYSSADLKLTPNKLILVFKSGSNSSVKNYGDDGLNLVRFVGSQLFIDNVSLVYDK